jgi:hypothetical protein
VKRPAEPHVQPLDFGMLLFDLGDAQSARIMRRARMVGDTQITVSATTGGLRHLFPRVDAIRSVGMGVQDTLNVFGLY